MTHTETTPHSQARNLVKLGYFPLPCEGKAAVGIGWTTRQDPFELPFREDHNVGIRGGEGGPGSYLLATDIDIDDEEIGDRVRGVFSLFGAPVRYGRFPRSLAVCRTEDPTKSRDLRYVGGGRSYKIQLLGKGRQFIGFGIHPDTLQPYSWPNESLLNVPLDSLPLVDVEQLIREIDAVMAGFGFHREIVAERDGVGGASLPADFTSDERERLARWGEGVVKSALAELKGMSAGTGRGGMAHELGLRIGPLVNDGLLNRERIANDIFEATNDLNAAFHSFSRGVDKSEGEATTREVENMRRGARLIEEAKAAGLPCEGFNLDGAAASAEADRIRIVEELERFAQTLKGKTGDTSRKLKADRRQFRAMVEAAATPVAGIGVTGEQSQRLLKAASAVGPRYAPTEPDEAFGAVALELIVNGVSVDAAFAMVVEAEQKATEDKIANDFGPWVVRVVGRGGDAETILDPKSADNHELFLTHADLRYGLGLTLRHDKFRKKRVVSGGNENLDPDMKRILTEGSIEAVERALEAIVNSKEGRGVWNKKAWSTKKERLGDCFLHNAEVNAFDSAIDALENLPTWDGQGRLTTWLSEAFGYPKGHALRNYVGAVGEQLAKSIVARILHPGCKLDEIAVLLGAQGQGKSRLAELMSSTILVDGFVDGLNPDASPKEVLELTAGKVVCELAELRGLHKRDVDRAKAFASRQKDRAREAYGRETSEVARRFTCIATANLVPKGMTAEELAALPDEEFPAAIDDADASFLVDETGNRRWLPVRVRVKAIDIAALRASLPQIYAEAKIAVEADVKQFGSPQLYLRGEAAIVARAQQAKHVVTSTLQDVLAEALEEALEALGDKKENAVLGVRDVDALIKDRLPRGAGPRQIEAAMNKLGWIKPRNKVAIKTGYGASPVRGFVLKTKPAGVGATPLLLVNGRFAVAPLPPKTERGNVVPFPANDATRDDPKNDASAH